jgi:transposase
MWTNENRARYDRSKLRYPSDLTDVEWGFVRPLIPPARRGGGKRRVSIREVMNGLMYVLSTGCQWRAIPKDFPPKSTVYGYFDLWTYDGTLERIHHALYVRCREAEGREASPTVAVIDSQSVKSAEKGGATSIRMAMMQARRSKARSGIFSSTRWACCFMRSFIAPIFKIAMAAFSSWARCLGNFHFFKNCSPMAATRAHNFARPRRKPCHAW